jgi:glycosyltransferase involved in cell wall biosynthesis
MNMPVSVIFILSVCGIALPLVGYPLMLLFVQAIRSRQHHIDSDLTPSVSVIVACRNAGDLLRDKITNTFALDYPRDSIELVVVSDGSTDDTETLAQGCGDPRLRFRALDRHRGKAAALNEAMIIARGEILVFSDVDARLAPGALRELVRHFADDSVGGVCGQRVLERERQSLRDAQASYVGWDSRIKLMENRIGSITSNDGKLYAVRASAAGPIAEGVTDDLYAALRVIAKGWRFIFEPRAIALVRVPARSPEHEISRRRRVVCRSLHGLRLNRELLNPRRFGVFALALGINKGLRRLLPVFLLTLLLSNGILALDDPVWRWPLLLQLGGYGLAMIGALAPSWRGPIGSLSRSAWYFVLGNVGTWLGLWDFISGRTVVRWDPNKGGVDRNAPVIAYTMSRFPKLTETFILSEILALLDQDYRIQVWPLIREHTRVRHADVERILPFVTWLPFLSPAILWSNLRLAFGRPGRYWGTCAEMIRGTRPSLNFLLGGLGLWPKAVHLARRLELGEVRHLHAHFATHPALVAWIVHRLTGIGYSFTAHGSDLHVDQTMLAQKIDAARFVVTISEYNKRFIEQRLRHPFADKIKVVHCGVDTRLFSPRPAHERTSAAALRILCIAALRDVKGHRYLIDACALLKRRGFAFHCELIGDGPLKKTIERQIQILGLTDQIRLLGPLPREAILEKLREQADVVSLNSIMVPRGNREGIPVTLMEAMACGLPVVSTRLSGIPELVEDGVSGLLTRPGHPDEIADALGRLAANPSLRAELGFAARERILASFDIADNVRHLIGLFQPYLDCPKPSPASES